ncbi:unnamed protein product [Prunus brigantina]
MQASSPTNSRKVFQQSTSAIIFFDSLFNASTSALSSPICSASSLEIWWSSESRCVQAFRQREWAPPDWFIWWSSESRFLCALFAVVVGHCSLPFVADLLISNGVLISSVGLGVLRDFGIENF